jgi:cation-transporting P-type ATPase E
VYSLILILLCFTGWFGLRFPYLPQQVTLLNWLVIGLPALVITFSRERSKAATRPRFLLEVGWFALRTGVVFALTGLVLLFIAHQLWPDPDLVFQHGEWVRRHRTQQTMLLSLLVLLGVTALFRALRDAEPVPLVGDRRFRILGIVAIPTYLLAMYVGPIAEFFVLKPLDLPQWVVVLACVAAGYGASVWTDYWRVGFLKDLEEERPATARGTG